MRKRLLTFLAFLPFVAGAQTVADFETPALPKVDTFFLSFNVHNKDIGLNSGLAHFPLYVDTQYKSFYGFTYSSKTDSMSGGYGNQFSARTAAGVNGSAQYAIAYGDTNKVILTGAAVGKSVAGFYVTNSSYAYYSIKFGDGYARKFGDTTGTKSGLPQGSYPDYFKLVIRGYAGGVLKPDTVETYLADYRFADSTKDYVLKDWRWVSLLKLGGVDSLHFRLYSTDTNSFGSKTPSYFCMDNFTTNEALGVNATGSEIIAKVYPNPAHNTLYLEMGAGSDVASMMLLDMSGRVLLSKKEPGAKESIDLDSLPVGAYLLQLTSGSGQAASQRIIKQ